MTIIDRMIANRQKRAATTAELDAELASLIYEAMTVHDVSWQDIGRALKISKQRVYQLRAAGDPHR
ncbi:hypothetical protein PBI_LUCKY2013_40 [Mycobacterium phage Lucky2013]|uniref:Helix-turn-helix DNA binding domain protein n=1 Tax=Mycobacterium phage Courthouse TaxID=2923000 RepID=G8I597_9CAUD|nr:hypothetical protein [Acinetobacter baumannii]YP_009011939.1 HTH DNA binding protein [Mycobacterium phage Courthouse]YP_009205170.1 HTH DNA binding protein [Mycobacterium phage Ariel]YP_009213257.1 HTH DNA binding protein [Mycobacterium phage MiaZeal]ASD50678.1 hypothetical protein PORCELAIN_39 [Mycobacterium phage Porcelain]ASD53433.1 hypothetical protein PBI_LUCKY2013_40 [Mycobacterium phage Lucky2013]ASZ74115.1 hypothetical protein SEA_SQUINT_39 [Mycobacterium phage Squint]ATN88850.1 h